MRRKIMFLVLFSTSIALFTLQTIQAFGIVAFHADFFKKKGIIVVDAGHGGEDGGAIAVNGVLEKDINLAIALELEKDLKQNNFEVIMVRNSDVSVGDSSLGTVSERYSGAQVFYSANREESAAWQNPFGKILLALCSRIINARINWLAAIYTL